MKEPEFEELWKSYDKKLEENLSLNKKNARDITSLKVQSLLSSMRPVKLFALITGLLWVGIGFLIIIPIFLYGFESANKFFLFSATIQLTVTAAGLWIYLYQLILINQTDITEPVLETQKRLAKLKSSTLWVAQIMFLQLPVWTTFWWNETMFNEWNLIQWSIALTVTLLALYAAVWLFINIDESNKDKKWFQLLFGDQEWSPIIHSIELIEQIQEYNDENK
ncbi:hypothetical protein [Fodinibius halophilus]|uniref:Uncharacterized protein n=1 Tax=Fodinibius halophilus TaxID=1736908 RepID=A0A6M1TC31_9BACT|nr:hypothetical protein [Fodinibius halophilus]NGP89923.1 hypothetical protein [Fodinibius halophilus]